MHLRRGVLLEASLETVQQLSLRTAALALALQCCNCELRLELCCCEFAKSWHGLDLSESWLTAAGNACLSALARACGGCRALWVWTQLLVGRFAAVGAHRLLSLQRLVHK
eukprot:4690028-Amphidinium_carterae.1